jgi:hypothetical protein
VGLSFGIVQARLIISQKKTFANQKLADYG